MKNLKIFTTLFLILVISFQGCSLPQKECKPVIKYEYLKEIKHSITNKPKFEKYKLYFTTINKENYVLIPIKDAIILKNNWFLYKNWCEENIESRIDGN